jgi:hypothetical protein
MNRSAGEGGMPDSTGDDAVSGENALEPNVIFVGRFEVKVRPRSDVTCSLMAVASPEAIGFLV